MNINYLMIGFPILFWFVLYPIMVYYYINIYCRKKEYKPNKFEKMTLGATEEKWGAFFMLIIAFCLVPFAGVLLPIIMPIGIVAIIWHFFS